MKPVRLFLANIGQRNPGFPLCSPPLGIMYLAAYIRSRFPAEILLANQKVNNCSNDALVRLAVSFAADIVGLSVMSPAAHNLAEITAAVKTIRPKTLIVLGGPHVSALGGMAMQGNRADAAVPGEGEVALEWILRSWREGRGPVDVPGIYRRGADGEIVRNPGVIPLIADIDDLPPPAYDLIDLPAYWKVQSMPPVPRRRYASLFSSRGCPYQCIYCHRIFGDSYRFHSAERIIDEMAYLQKQYGIRDFEFLDDIFNLQKDRLPRFLDLIGRRNIKPKLVFPNALRTDLLTKEEITGLVEAGLYFSSFALETGSPRLQKLIKKNLDIERFLENVAFAVSKGVFANGFAMMGFPTETEAELQQTIAVACGSRLHSISFFTVTPFPGSELYQMVARDNPRLLEGLRYDDIEYANIPVNLSAVADETLFYYQRKANRRFYLSPSRLARMLRAFPQPHLLFMYIPVFIKRALSVRRGS